MPNPELARWGEGARAPAQKSAAPLPIPDQRKFGPTNPPRGSSLPRYNVSLRFCAGLRSGRFACEAVAAERGCDELVAGVNAARHDAYRHMIDRGFRTLIS